MSKCGVEKFIERQIVEHGVCVGLEKYPKDFVYGTLRVILSAGVPDLSGLESETNWEASHLLSLASLQTATNVGRQGTLEMLAPEMIQAKFRRGFIEKINETGRLAMALTARFGTRYWNEDIYLDGSGESYKEDSKVSDNFW